MNRRDPAWRHEPNLISLLLHASCESLSSFYDVCDRWTQRILALTYVQVEQDRGTSGEPDDLRSKSTVDYFLTILSQVANHILHTFIQATTVRSPFPFDILYIILTHADWETLKALGCVSRDLHHEANKYLWRRVWLDAPVGSPDTTILESRLALILHDPRRACCVRELDIAITSPITERPQFFDGEGNIIHRIIRALLQVPKLHTLRLYIVSHGNYHKQLVTELSAGIFPFHLTSFASNIDVEDGLEPFLRSQPSIEEYEILYNWRMSDHVPFPDTFLPSLRRVRAGNVDRVADLVRGRAVHAISVASELRLEGVPVLATAIRSSTVDVTELGLAIRQGIRQHLEPLVSAVPKLRSLEVLSSLEANMILEDVEELVAVLGCFRHLEIMRWSPRTSVGFWSQRHEFMNACGSACHSLHTIIFGRSDRSAERYVRQGPSDSWTLQARAA